MRTDWPLGPALKRKREEAGISARAAARRAGISSGRWYQLETGVQKAKGQEIPIGTTAATVVSVAKAVDWDIEDALAVAGFDVRDAVAASVPPRPLQAATTDELLNEIRRRLDDVELTDHSEEWPWRNTGGGAAGGISPAP